MHAEYQQQLRREREHKAILWGTASDEPTNRQVKRQPDSIQMIKDDLLRRGDRGAKFGRDDLLLDYVNNFRLVLETEKFGNLSYVGVRFFNGNGKLSPKVYCYKTQCVKKARKGDLVVVTVAASRCIVQVAEEGKDLTDSQRLPATSRLYGVIGE